MLLYGDNLLDRIMACLCKVEYEDYLIKKVLEVMEGMKERKDYLLKLLTLTELRPNLRIRISEDVVHMPIVVRPEDIRLPKSKLEKDPLYRVGLEEGKQIEVKEGLLISAQLEKLVVSYEPLRVLEELFNMGQ